MAHERNKQIDSTQKGCPIIEKMNDDLFCLQKYKVFLE
ncbi:hypothetical protein EHR_03675 [Enterococcus hirae ATCC 9790]|uniref:Uncharacterized protein n=1 Tax=Enterococcus hirae (strain ATCC 9790 / DSM 20160 / JCM 8729 / LMG 6399 / NBRC 3181 / NCIMB 6459 / NCDO 1258 / NCTC 12367 / WDCM 00089 / R) TaxID=768486 RepID=I6SWF4_ENTHA|nr:hypothetical protein EHR_03675 [Enterococcus hirae ATCC 9790]